MGTHLTVQNTSTPWVYLAESDTSPDENTFYKTITNLGQSSAEADVLSGALRLWAKSSQAASGAVIAVQEV